MITLIAAAAQNNALGKDNKMLWHLPADFKHFKSLTTGHYIIMGRKTFESLPGILPNRTHVIITRQKDFKADGCKVAGSLQEAIDLVPDEEDCFVIGGGEMYKLALPVADAVELTRVHATFDADAFFPELPETDWKLIRETHHEADEKHAYSFTFQTFHRK